MSDVFVSYKREDEERVLVLIEALQHERLDVWWDQHIGGGEAWRATILAALEDARCVVVCWSAASVRSEWVLEEASRAKDRGVLIPICLDDTPPPFGFGELQALDLRHWRGRRDDAFFLDVLAAIQAKLAGGPTPRPKGPTKRLRSRVTLASVATTVAVVSGVLGLNVLGLQDQLCRAPVVRDLCGLGRFGGAPTRADRLDWEALPTGRGSCEALKAHRDRFVETCVHLDQVTALLANPDLDSDVKWSPASKPLRLFVGMDGDGWPTEAEAQADLDRRALALGQEKCRGFSSDNATVRKATTGSVTWDANGPTCEAFSDGWRCKANGEARCDFERAQSHPVCLREVP